MTNPAERKQQAQLELLKLFVQRQLEAGRWLMASLILVNGGALIALFSNEAFGKIVLPAAGPWFAAGVVLAIITGAMSWLLSNQYFYGLRKALGIKMFRAENLNVEVSNASVAVITVAMIVMGSASLFFFAYGSWCAAEALPAATSHSSTETNGQK